MDLELDGPTLVIVAAITGFVVVVTTILVLVFGILPSASAKAGGSDASAIPKSDISPALAREERESVSSGTSGKMEKVLNAAVFKQFNILEIKTLSHNTKLFRFEIPFGKPLGLPIGRHLSLRGEVNGTKVIRAYTPTSRPDQHGYFDLVIKTYEFGKLSQYLHSLQVGATVDIRGPVGRFKYIRNMYPRIGLIGAGTGLTPCLQVIRCILEGGTTATAAAAGDKEDKEEDRTSFLFYYQNRTEQDILLKDELDRLHEKYPERLKIVYFLSNPQTESFGSGLNEIRGYINRTAIQEGMRPDSCPLVCICGPSGFNETMKTLLLAEGHTTASTTAPSEGGKDGSIYIW